jgi:hypothetical protein
MQQRRLREEIEEDMQENLMTSKPYVPLTSLKWYRKYFKGMAMSTVNFLVSELRNARREPRGRRWTIEEKVVALVLMKRSRKVLQIFEQNRHHAKINSGCVSEKTPGLR